MATIISGIYQKQLEKDKIKVVLPNSTEQKKFMEKSKNDNLLDPLKIAARKIISNKIDNIYSKVKQYHIPS